MRVIRLIDWVVKTYHWFLRKKPIVIFVTIDNEMIIESFDISILPREGEIVHFNYDGPFYVVHRISHLYNMRHQIWVALKPMISRDLE